MLALPSLSASMNPQILLNT